MLEASKRKKRYASSAPGAPAIAKHSGRISLALPGVAVLTWALAAPLFRGPNGLLLPESWVLVTAGVALMLMGVAWRTEWRKFSWLMSLALLGQASALNLLLTPSANVLEHHLAWGVLLTTPKGLLLLAPLTQAALAVWAIWRYRRALASMLDRMVTRFQLLALAGLAVAGAANASFDLSRYAGEIVLGLWVLSAGAVNLVLVAAAVPQGSLSRMAEWLNRHLGATSSVKEAPRNTWDRLLPWAAAAWAVVMAATLSWAVFERVPHIPDGVSYLFQAKYFSAGQLFLPPPPDAAAFEFEKFHNDGARWFAYSFPGWPAILSLGVLAGVAWLVNPILAGVTVLVAHWLVSHLYNRSLAHIVALLLAVSPWFLFMSASFMPHPTTVVCTLIALLGVVKAQRTRSWVWALIGGAALGGLLLTRPLEAVLVAAAIGLWLFIPRLSITWKPLAALAVGSLLVGGLLLLYNQTLTGSYFRTPHQVMTDARYYPGADRLGFGSEVGTFGWRHLDPLPGHGPMDVLINAHMNFYMSNFELFGWTFGSVFFVALLVLWKRFQRPDWLFVGIIVAVVGGHSLFWFSGGPDIGARYWYQILAPLVVLTARGIQEVRNRWVERSGSPLCGWRVGAFVAAASLVALLTFIPWRSLAKYPDYRGMNSDVAQLAREYDFGHSLVFVQTPEPGDYARALILNPPTLGSEGTIYAQDLGAESRARVMDQFPDRKVWVIRADSTGAPYSVVSGPLSGP